MNDHVIVIVVDKVLEKPKEGVKDESSDNWWTRHGDCRRRSNV